MDPVEEGNSAKIYRFYSADSFLRIAAVNSTAVVREICDLQGSSPIATLGLSRLVTGAALMASHLREGQQLGVQFSGNGPLGQLFAEASFEGEVRGFCSNPEFDAQDDANRLNLSAALGSGVVTVVRNQPFQKSPHIGTVEIRFGEIAEDLAYYLQQSQQIPSVVALSTFLTEFGKVEAAGGIIIEVMPGASDELITELEKQSLKAGSLRQHLKNGESMANIVERFVGKRMAAGLQPIEHPHAMRFQCKCSTDRIERSLALLGTQTLQELVQDAIKTNGVVAMRCEFCRRPYTVSVAQLRQLIVESDTSIQ